MKLNCQRASQQRTSCSNYRSNIPGSRPLALADQRRGVALVLDALAQGVAELQVAAGQTD